MLRVPQDHAESKTETSVYFDTDTQTLRKHGLLLRVRRTGNRRVQTIKAIRGGELFARDEWEIEIATDMPDLRLARGTALAPLLNGRLSRRLKPVFETKVRRTTYSLSDDTRTVALTIDKGRIDTGSRSQPLCEIELELKRGEEEALFDSARLVEALPAELALKSKAERGYDLLKRAEVAAVHAAPIELEAKQPARDGFCAIGSSCLKQIVGNVAALRAGDAEAVHQIRVGLRRLRAALSLFGDILGDAETAAIKRELKWLTGELARAREFEVLVTRVVAPVERRHARMGGLSRIAHDLAEQRAAAIERAKTAVGSSRFRRMTVDIAAWLEAGAWRKPKDDLVADRGEVALATFAGEQLDGRWKKLRKRGKSLRTLDASARHKLRIQGKKLRYASEFFAALFPGQKAVKRGFLSALEELQDCLGDLNDIAVDEDLSVANAGLNWRDRRQSGGRRRAFAAGLLTGREEARFDAALEAASKAWAKLVKIKPFW